MNTLHNVASLATPVVGAGLAGIASYAVALLKSGRLGPAVAAAEKAAPEIERAVDEAEKVPAVEHLIEDIEAKAKAEAERLNAATHGAIDVLAAELAKWIPNAIQQAILSAHSTVGPVVESTPAIEAPPAPVVPAAEPPAVSEEAVTETAPPVAAAGAPIVTASKGSAPA